MALTRYILSVVEDEVRISTWVEPYQCSTDKWVCYKAKPTKSTRSKLPTATTNLVFLHCMWLTRNMLVDARRNTDSLPGILSTFLTLKISLTLICSMNQDHRRSYCQQYHLILIIISSKDQLSSVVPDSTVSILLSQISHKNHDPNKLTKVDKSATTNKTITTATITTKTTITITITITVTNTITMTAIKTVNHNTIIHYKKSLPKHHDVNPK